mmetsp:Transcript_3712/g.10474  ORF Transcript_3712/g.10474 Transcript_3712/m.10474 type:complete len:120 (-) Transcript_3712:112-471(-)|eukprot:366300-Chlamydomonas_euryale.AAC.9
MACAGVEPSSACGQATNIGTAVARPLQPGSDHEKIFAMRPGRDRRKIFAARQRASKHRWHEARQRLSDQPRQHLGCSAVMQRLIVQLNLNLGREMAGRPNTGGLNTLAVHASDAWRRYT